ncbi:MAG: hypothetical protein L3J62_07420 [Gammaproteobacteria bacterium]|nr:hypothetical protein [Gammaproteobacteria bacterium]MCF6230605.1 hypothetical protein [Gammaproteobacteria bacterium]
MTWLIILLIVLIGSVLLALVATQEPGYVLIVYQGWSIETSLTLLVATIAVSMIIGYYTIRSLAGMLGAPQRFGAWRCNKQAIRSETALNNGILALFEGDWKRAEKQLIKYIKQSHSPQLSYLGAARAAHELGAFERRDKYLNQAAQVEATSNIVVGLTRARLQLEHKQYEEALALLENIYHKVPKHPSVLRLLAPLYQQLNEWQRLEDLLPALQRHQVFSSNELQQLQHGCYSHLLTHYAKIHDYPTLNQLWHRIPKSLRQDPGIIQHYVGILLSLKREDEAEQLLRTVLQKQWHGELLTLYGRIKTSKSQAQLIHAEQWLLTHKNDPQLLLALGRICINNQLWGKAKEYLQKAVDLGQQEAFPLLAEVLEQLGDDELAQEYCRKGVKLLTKG